MRLERYEDIHASDGHVVSAITRVTRNLLSKVIILTSGNCEKLSKNYLQFRSNKNYASTDQKKSFSVYNEIRFITYSFTSYPKYCNTKISNSYCSFFLELQIICFW